MTQTKISNINYNLASCFQILHFRLISAKRASPKTYAENGLFCQLTRKSKSRLPLILKWSSKETTEYYFLNQQSTKIKSEFRNQKDNLPTIIKS